MLCMEKEHYDSECSDTVKSKNSIIITIHACTEAAYRRERKQQQLQRNKRVSTVISTITDGGIPSSCRTA